MEFIGDLLKIFWPFLLIYAISRIQKFLREQKGEGAGTQHSTETEMQQRLQRRAEVLAAKQQRKRTQQPSTTIPQRQQPVQPPSPPSSKKQQPLHFSDEDLVERLGIAEYERRVEKGEISAEGEHVTPAPRYTAEHHDGMSTILASLPLRQVVLAREVLDKPRALRPHRPPFQS